jgi:TrmH family RNA methyltransferase
MVITSKDNPKIKALAALHRRENARREGVVFIEGERLCRDAIESGAAIREVVVTEENQDWASDYARGADVTVVSEKCFEKIASTVHPQGIACVAGQPGLKGTIPFRGDGRDIYCYLEDIQDPGNLGTIIRTADAFDFTAVIMSPNTCDPFNEKTLRASMGSVWHLPLVTATPDEAFAFFSRKSVTSLAMHLKGEELSAADISLPAAYLIGNEGRGLSDGTSSLCNKLVRIPMPGRAESLNAAAAASIMGYVLQTLR